MDYGQLVIVHMAHAPVRRPPRANAEDRYYRSLSLGLPRARLPHLRLGGIMTLFTRNPLRPLARVQAQ